MRNQLVISCIWFGACVGASALHAQSTNVSTNPIADSGGLEEIVVTAERRVESAQKTPISMSVISAEEIQQKGIADISTLSANDTSLNFSTNGGEGYLTVRGVSSHDVTEIGDPAVPVVIDGFTMIPAYGLSTALYDLARIEVLRGPQGTLYGRNAEGGLVNIVSQRPNLDFGVGASAELGNYNTNNISAWLNLPVNDWLALRLSGASRRHDGYRNVLPTNGTTEFKADDEDSRSIRLQASLTPVEKLDIWLLFQTTQIGGHGAAAQDIPFAPGITPAPTTANPTPVADISHDKPYLGNGRDVTMYGPLDQDIDDKVYKWQFTYSGLPWGISAIYQGGYDNMQWHKVTPAPTLLGNPITTPVVFFQNEFPKTTNNEIRFASDSTRPFVWQAGLYYFEERNTNLNSYALINPFSPAQTYGIHFQFPIVDTKSHAGFGQASYSINDQNKVTAGVRYSRDTKLRTGTFDLNAFGIFGIDEYGQAESSKTTYHAGYDWTPTSTNLVYAKFDTGYKPGGFTTCNPYDPETVKSTEIGSKNRFLNNTLQVNGAAFYNQYENQQVSSLSASCASGTVVQNAGSSKIYGIEISLDDLITSVDRIDVSMTLLHARYDKFLAYPVNGSATLYANCARIQDSNCDLTGNMLPQAPNLSAAIGYEHKWQLSGGNSFSVRGEAKYQSKQYFDAFNFPDSEQSGFALLNAYIGYRAEKWRVNLFGRNLANKLYLADAIENTTGNSSTYRFGFGAPRTFGVHVEANF